MNYFVKLFTTIILITIFFACIIYMVDPYDKLQHNMLNLKIKGVFDNRTNKFRDLDKNKNKYEAFILGSSRGMQLQPFIVQKATGLKTFNYSVFTANPQDYLAITRFIMQVQKPKLIWINLDFFALNKNMKTVQKLFNSPLKDYLIKVNKKQDDSKFIYFITKYYSFDALKDSITVLKKNIKGDIKKHYKEDGENLTVYQDKLKYKILQEYWNKEYLNYEISQERLDMLKEIKRICEKNNIKLIVSLSPVSYPHLEKIKSDALLYEKSKEVKKELCHIFGTYIDFFNDDIFLYSQAKYWIDSVHPSTIMGKKITQEVFFNKDENFGKIIKCSE